MRARMGKTARSQDGDGTRHLRQLLNSQTPRRAEALAKAGQPTTPPPKASQGKSDLLGPSRSYDHVGGRVKTRSNPLSVRQASAVISKKQTGVPRLSLTLSVQKAEKMETGKIPVPRQEPRPSPAFSAD